MRRSLNRCLLVAIMVCLLLGQLLRITITPQVAFYVHDILIVFYLCVNNKQLTRLIKKAIEYLKKCNLKKHYFKVLIYALVVLFYTSRLVWYPVAALYTARLLIYSIWLITLWHFSPFTSRQWRNMLAWFFICFAGLGLMQYLCLPDTRWLQVLGWDDHYYRLIGTWLDPAFTGLALTLGLCWWTYHRLALTNQWGKLVFNGCWLLLLICLLLTFSRASYLAAASCAIVYWWWRCQTQHYLMKTTWHRPVLTVVSFLLIATILLSWLAVKNPSDSTNLLRVNSGQIRLAMLHTQLSSLTVSDWLVGRGLFVPLSANGHLTATAISGKQTAAFPDNLEVLLISFFGLPVACYLFYQLYRFLSWCWYRQPLLFSLTFAIIINAQFNQAVFQPFVFLVWGIALVGCRLIRN